MIQKIISGGQSGADLAGNYFAKKYQIETEINAEKNYKPLYDTIPTDIKINIVSNKKGKEGGWVERRRYNIQSSDFTLILLGKSISETRGSLGTWNDCKRLKKDCFCVNIHNPKDIDDIRFLLNRLCPKTINIAGERSLNKEEVISVLEKILL